MAPPVAPFIVARTDATLRLYRSDGTEHPFPPASRAAAPTAAPSAALKWYPSGKLLTEGTAAGSIVFRRHDGLHPIRTLDAAAHTGAASAPITTLDISAGSRYLATGSADGILAVWDMKTNSVLSTFRSAHPIVALAFQSTPDSRYLACATAHAITLYSCASERLVARFTVSTTAHDASHSFSHTPRQSLAAPAVKVTAIGFSPHHHNLLVATDDTGCVNVWDISRKLTAHAGVDSSTATPTDVTATYSRFTTTLRAPATDLSFASAASDVALCVGGFDKQLRLFDKALRKLLFSVSCTAPISSVSFASDGRQVAAGLTNGSIAVMRLDVESGRGQLVTEITNVHLSQRSGDMRSVSTAVRSVHFQPTPSSTLKSLGKVKSPVLGTERAVARPAPSSFGASRSYSAFRVKPGGSTESAANSAVPEEPDEPRTVKYAPPPARGMRVLGAPRDSDIFSPIVPRNAPARRPFGERLFTGHALSFQDPPAQKPDVKNERAIETSQSVTDLRLAKDEVLKIDDDDDFLFLKDEDDITPERQSPSVVESGRDEAWDVDVADSDSVDSIVGKSPPKSVPSLGKYSTHSDVSQLHGSSVSDYNTEVPTNVGEESEKRIDDDASSSFSSIRQRRLQMAKGSFETSVKTALPPKPPHAGESYKVTEKPVNQITASSLDISQTYLHNSRDVSSSHFEGTQLSPRDESAPLSESRMSSESESVEVPTRRRSVERRAEGSVGMKDTSMKPGWMAALSGELRSIVAQEIDALRMDLRSDVLNIHTELVVTSARHSKELKAAFEERDRTVQQLEEEIIRLRSDNQRLRTKYGLG